MSSTWIFNKLHYVDCVARRTAKYDKETQAQTNVWCQHKVATIISKTQHDLHMCISRDFREAFCFLQQGRAANLFVDDMERATTHAKGTHACANEHILPQALAHPLSHERKLTYTWEPRLTMQKNTTPFSFFFLTRFGN